MTQDVGMRNTILSKDEITYCVQVGVLRADCYTCDACEVPTVFSGATSIISSN